MGQSKKFKNQICVYCRVNLSTTADHVFPRKLFQPERRNEIPKVPACKECNNEKSKLEHYLLAVLPFGGNHFDAERALKIDVRRRLAKNEKLHDSLKESFKDNISLSDLKETLSGISIDFEQLDSLVGFIGKGLLWHHWKIYLPINYSFKVFMPSEMGINFLHDLFNMQTRYRVNKTSLGIDTVIYKGVMSESDNGLSIWCIQFLGGLTVVDEYAKKTFKNSFYAVITGDVKTIERLK